MPLKRHRGTSPDYARSLRSGISPGTELRLARWVVWGHSLLVDLHNRAVDALTRLIRTRIRTLLTYSEGHRILRDYTDGNRVDTIRITWAADPATAAFGRMLSGPIDDRCWHQRVRRERREARRLLLVAQDELLALQHWFGRET